MTATLQGHNPRTGQPVGVPVPDSDASTIEKALVRAWDARRAVSSTSLEQRSAWLRGISAALSEHRQDLVELADSETGIGAGRLEMELERTCVQTELFVQVLADRGYLGVMIDHPDPDARPVARPDVRRVLQPLGPVAVWAASNFPFAFGVVGGDTISALAAGCPVLVKSHPSHPSLSVRLGQLVRDALEDAGAPQGAFDVLHGDEAGLTLIADARIRAGAFTGSLSGGRALLDKANARPDPIPFFGELGSNNPVFITSAAAIERKGEIAEGFVASLTLGSGQLCTKPGIVLVPKASGLSESIKKALPAELPVPLLNERIHTSYREGAKRLLEAAPPDGSVVPADLSDKPGFWTTPALAVVDSSVFRDQFAALSQECFGPFGLVVECASDDDLVDVARLFRGCLTGTIHAEETDRVLAARLMEELAERVGRIIWNGWPTGVAVTWAMQHGGPYPATTSSATTSVGATAINRFLRPVAYQSVPQFLLPEHLRDTSKAPRRVNGTVIAPS